MWITHQISHSKGYGRFVKIEEKWRKRRIFSNFPYLDPVLKSFNQC